MKKVFKLYEELFALHGKQGWWPIQGVYDGRLPNKKEQLEICIGAILTQNTSWVNVEKALAQLSGKIHEKALRMPQEKLAVLIKPAGYFNQKAKKIHCFLDFLASKKEVDRENLLAVWGIGPETVDSMLLYAYQQPYFVVDAYTKRILEHYKIIKAHASYEEVQNLFHKELPRDVELFKEYHALFVAHAKKYYSKKPYGIGDPLLGDFKK
ncbi:hypothetical protein HZA98_04410 [Candidatus Woesearchaeota archaeon]|nr:hypothetical protein [Candidatus Woesearchaeota archaeon]